MTQAVEAVPSSGQRLRWLDGIKGLAILWIAYFHCFEAYINKRLPSPLNAHYFASFIQQSAPKSLGAMIACVGEAIYSAIAGVGFHAVGVFIVMSGFGLTYSLARTGGPRDGWRGWYGSRLVRLFPMYWMAHLLYLVSPLEARLEPVDARFILSFFGDRVAPIYTMFYYLNPAWWYFGLILELYLVFPLLFALMRKVGTGWFLAIGAVETILSRYVILFVLKTSGYYLLGAFFGCRLWEFALGMVVGVWYRQARPWVDDRLFSFGGLIVGVALYTAGLYTYPSAPAYTLTDGLIGTGLFIMLAQMASQARRLPRFEATISYIGVYSYGFYLIHQPYVIAFGVWTRNWSMPIFALAALIPVTLLAIGAIGVERLVNSVTDRVLSRSAGSADALVKQASA